MTNRRRTLRYVKSGARRLLRLLPLPFRVGRSTDQRYLNVAMSIEGQISRAEAAQLLALARDSTPQTAIVEIGTYRGRSTAALAFGSLMGSCNRVYAVDPHDEFIGVLGGHFGSQDQAALYRNLAMARIGEVVAVVCLPSDAAARAWSQKNVGLLWIDGDHRYEAVRRDYHSWSGLLAEDATVAFHDRSTPGVARLISELTEEGTILPIGTLGDLAWFSHRER